MVDLKALCVECGVDLYDVEVANENRRAIYRVYITKQGGISLDDCTKLSKLLSPIYDVEPPINGDWTLEVSSPGLERKLERAEHFASSIDELVTITTIDKEKFSGKIITFDGDVVEILQDDGKSVEIKFPNIKKARTYIEW